MTIDRAHVQRWLDRYLAAWLSYDANEVADLFAEGAEYRYHPWDSEPVRGRAAIVEDWVTPDGSADNRDAPGTIAGEYEAWAVDGNRAVAIGRSTYYTDATRTTVENIFWNNWLLEFDDDGRCTSFIEYFMAHPKR